MVDIDSSFIKRLEPGGEGQLSPEKLAQLKSIASQFEINTGQLGLIVGASSSQKTLTGSLLERLTGYDLYRVDLAMVISKYIGETEKNLSQVFEASEKLDAVLLFDEADSLFGKRSEVSDSHDRFANIEVSYLLERMESYSGLVILTSNLRSNIDEAFLRRMTWVIDFSEPIVVQRLSLWRRILNWSKS